MRSIDVYDFCFLYIEDAEEVTIWSAEKEENVFEGTFREAMDSDYAYEEVNSFGIENGRICINID